MKETAPQRYELPNAPPNKALVFLPWKRKGDNEATAGDTPQSRNKKHYIHFPSRFFNFSFSDLPTCHHFRPVTASTLSASTLSASTPDRSHRNARIYAPKSCSGQLYHLWQNNSLFSNYEPYFRTFPCCGDLAKNFLPKIGCFLVC